MLEKLKSLDVILILLILLSLSSLREINVAQAIVAIGVFGLYGYNRWLEISKRPDIAADLKRDIENLNDKMSAIVIKNTAKPQQTQEIKRFF